MDLATKNTFQQAVKQHYRLHGRRLPWRLQEADNSYDAYKVLVSEIMLQQTQVARVEPKFCDFIDAFPSINNLASASGADVLRLWSGLGYNRRAMYLLEASRHLEGATQPWTIELLNACRGIGYNTAAAICVYAYNQAHVFVETNVRTVYIHHFFPGQDVVDDKDILSLIEQTMDTTNPREFYWALMDYGSWLKISGNQNVKRSKQYNRQSVFHGSRRQLRGQIIRLLTQNGSQHITEIEQIIDDDRLNVVIADLRHEGLIT
ncbi:MAG: A/G-specific adenine glycosylase, partial [Actinobacteria bacterium]|nr:A/G-specific adenine glycosylase [Actinomycetota bacterium]